MDNFDREEAKKQMDFDRYMGLASGFRNKGNYEQAQSMVIEALALFPENLDAREFAADILFARGELEKAAEHYKSLFSEEHPRPSAEEKYGSVVIQIAEGKRQRMLLEQMLENPTQFRKQTANPYLAAVLGAAPGFGHIYAGKLKKGVALFCSAALCWILSYYLSPAIDKTLPIAARTYAFLNAMFSFPAFIFVAASAGIAIYSVIDAAVTVDKERTKQAENAPEVKSDI